MAIRFGSDSDALAGVFPSSADAGQRYLNSDLLAAALAAPYSRLGVLSDVLDEFNVEHSSGMRITIGHGFALVGTRDNPAPVINYGGPTGMTEEAITIPDGDATDRIDLISIRAQFGAVNKVSVERTGGTPGSGSAPAAPSQTDDDYYLPIATVTVPASASVITDANITNLITRFASVRPSGQIDVDAVNQFEALRQVITLSTDCIGYTDNSRLLTRDATKFWLTREASIVRADNENNDRIVEFDLAQGAITPNGTEIVATAGNSFGVQVPYYDETSGNLYIAQVRFSAGTPTIRFVIVEGAVNLTWQSGLWGGGGDGSNGANDKTFARGDGSIGIQSSDGSDLYVGGTDGVTRYSVLANATQFLLTQQANVTDTASDYFFSASGTDGEVLVGRTAGGNVQQQQADGTLRAATLDMATLRVFGTTVAQNSDVDWATFTRISGLLCWVVCKDNVVTIAPVRGSSGLPVGFLPYRGSGQ